MPKTPLRDRIDPCTTGTGAVCIEQAFTHPEFQRITAMSKTETQIVYVLTNPSMPGLVKIGKTVKAEISERMKQLYGTGVPVPFECAFACNVKDASEVENALHLAFGMTRLNPNREFFRIEPERVIAVLQLLRIDDITTQIENTINNEVETIDKQARAALVASRRPKMNFIELGIPVGSVIVSKDGGKQAIIVGEKKVEFEGVECSLTAATRKMFGLPDDYALQPSPHWTFNGETLREIYDQVHVVSGED